MKFIAFSDVHGSVESLRNAEQFIRRQNDIDSIVIAGDFASINYDESNEGGILKEEIKTKKMFEMLEGLGIKYYFVWGNRDFFFFMDKSTKDLSPKQVAKKFLGELNLQYGICLNEKRNELLPFLEKFKITGNPSRVDENTIYLTHWQKNVQSNALLHLEGHVHYGQLKDNYVNLCFLYRDSLHGADELLGGLWVIKLSETRDLSIEFINLGGKVKIIACPIHSNEGNFYVPYFWRKCPVYYDENNVKFS